MRIKFDVRGLRRFVVVVGLCLLGLLGGGVLAGLAWLLWQWQGGWVGAGLSLLLLTAAALAVRLVAFERKDQGQEIQEQEDQGQEVQTQEDQGQEIQDQEDGLRSDKYYDMAFELTRQGKTRKQAWQWYCEELNIPIDDADKHHTFNVAMGRRKKGEVKGTEKRHAITQQ